MKTTLNQIKKHDPCTNGWEKLLAFLGKTKADDEDLPLLTILESNGLDDCLWALRCADGKDKELRLISADFAESVLHNFEKKYPDDNRPRLAIQAARDYANGLIDSAARSAAYSTARSAADSVAYSAAYYAAISASRSAAYYAACSAADSVCYSAAYYATYYAAYYAAYSTAYSTAHSTEKQKQIEIIKKYF